MQDGQDSIRMSLSLNRSMQSFKKLFTLITAVRLTVFMLLLGAVWFNPVGASCLTGSLEQLSMLLGTAFLFTVLFTIWYRISGPGRWINFWQTLADVFLVSLAVFYTGGFRSSFSFLYVLAIVTACLLGGIVPGAVAALLSTLSYAAVCFFTPGAVENAGEAAYSFAVNLAAFNMTAVFGVWIAQRLRRTEAELSSVAAEMARMEKIQQHLADSIRSGLVMVNGDGRIIFYNRSAVNILGSSMRDSHGKSLSEIWPELDSIERNIEKNSAVQRREIRFSGPDIKEKILGVSTFPVRDEKNVSLGFGIIFQDITEIIVKEEQLHRMDRLAYLGEMAAGLAHEIRNPLASISGAAQVLAESDFIPPEGRRLIDIISRETGRLNRLTNSFLLYGRPTRETVELVDVNAEMEEIVELIGRRRNLPQADIIADIPGDAVMETEPSQLRQILVNILLNAWQSLPEQGGRITISVKIRDEMLELVIRDNGCGISPADMKRIFNPFFTTKAKGTGLGLAIVQRLVHDLGGTIDIRSEVGRGTEVVLKFPLAEDERQEEGTEERQEQD